MKAAIACADGVEMLMDYIEGTLPAADRELVAAHVSACPRCVAFVESYRQTPRIMRAATAAEMQAAGRGDLKQRFRHC